MGGDPGMPGVVVHGFHVRGAFNGGGGRPAWCVPDGGGGVFRSPVVGAAHLVGADHPNMSGGVFHPHGPAVTWVPSRRFPARVFQVIPAAPRVPDCCTPPGVCQVVTPPAGMPHPVFDVDAAVRMLPAPHPRR